MAWEKPGPGAAIDGGGVATLLPTLGGLDAGLHQGSPGLSTAVCRVSKRHRSACCPPRLEWRGHVQAIGRLRSDQGGAGPIRKMVTRVRLRCCQTEHLAIETPDSPSNTLTAPPSRSDGNLSGHFQLPLPIFTLLKDLLSPIPSTHDVINHAGVFKSYRAAQGIAAAGPPDPRIGI